MKVLLVGGGGREHALAWKIRQSPRCSSLWCAPGNPGMAELGECIPIEPNDTRAIVSFAREQEPDLVVIGPEGPLVAGLADCLRESGSAVFGPSSRAAQIEGSKVFAKALMQRKSVPTAAYRSFDRFEAAQDYLDFCAEQGVSSLVVKASGLAGGKGAVVCDSIREARSTLRAMMLDRALGAAGAEVVIEERLAGPEASILAITDGERVVYCPPAQDYKPVGEGNTGLNTGGMGALAPTSVANPADLGFIRSRVFEPTLEGLVEDDRRFLGCLYAGMMMSARGPTVIEFNCRFGDPEAQVILPLLTGDFLTLLASTAHGSVAVDSAASSGQSSVCVVLTSAGYPGAYSSGYPIEGIEAARAIPGVLVFHAGTAVRDGRVVTSGGRVLNVVGVADDAPEAARRAYEAVAQIHFEGLYYRRDIASDLPV